MDFLKFLTNQENASSMTKELGWLSPVQGSATPENSFPQLIKTLEDMGQASQFAIWLDTVAPCRRGERVPRRCAGHVGGQYNPSRSCRRSRTQPSQGSKQVNGISGVPRSRPTVIQQVMKRTRIMSYCIDTLAGVVVGTACRRPVVHVRVLPDRGQLPTQLLLLERIHPTPTFVGVDNYVTAAEDPVFWRAPVQQHCVRGRLVDLPGRLALVLAAVLEEFVGRRCGVLRTLYFIPAAMSITVVGILFSFIYNPEFGLLNQALEAIGLGQFATAWLGRRARRSGASSR